MKQLRWMRHPLEEASRLQQTWMAIRTNAVEAGRRKAKLWQLPARNDTGNAFAPMRGFPATASNLPKQTKRSPTGSAERPASPHSTLDLRSQPEQPFASCPTAAWPPAYGARSTGADRRERACTASPRQIRTHPEAPDPTQVRAGPECFRLRGSF